MIAELFSIYLRMLVLYSPFFVLSCFISMTRGYAPRERKHLAWRVATGVLIASLLLYLFGRYIFDLFGITIDASASAPAACCSSPRWAWPRARRWRRATTSTRT